MKNPWDIDGVTPKCHIHDPRGRGRVTMCTYYVWLLCIVTICVPVCSHYTQSLCVVATEKSVPRPGGTVQGECLMEKRPPWPLRWGRRLVADGGITLKTLPQEEGALSLLFDPLWRPCLHIFHSFVIFIMILRTCFNVLWGLFICKSRPNRALRWVRSHKCVACCWKTQFSQKDHKLTLQMICLELAHSF